MSANDELAHIFERMAQMLELTGADSFRVSAHARAARAIAEQTKDLRGLASDQKALTAIDGIGAKTAKKIAEYAETGSISEHDALAAKVPAGLLQLLRIPGVGPKTVRAMWEDKGVEGPEDLRTIIDDGSIMDLPRMGAKTVENIRKALKFADHGEQRSRLGDAMPIAEVIVEKMAAVEGVTQAAFAGSLRRGKETIGDLDILVTSTAPQVVREAFLSMPIIVEVLAQGETKCSVRVRADGREIQTDLRIVPEESWGAALMYFTGSKEHNVKLRERSLKRGLTLNEYGLYPVDDEDGPPQRRGVVPVASQREEDIYDALGLPWIAPELREDRGEVSDDRTPPALITLEDIKSELHSHTTASDGRMSIEELATRAKERGFHTIAVTDHSKSSVIANGLDEDRLRAHIAAVRASKVTGITILAGSEVDILPDGSLDYDDELLAELDVVVASPHASLRQETKAATKRMIKAIEHPLVHVIGHPTGRIIGRRDGLPLDIEEIVSAAAEHDVALEINANTVRLDLQDLHVAAAMEAGAKIAIDCDVHREEDFEHLRYGVLTGRRGGLTADACVNTWGARKLRTWLRSKGRD
ncbi:MAG: DNA polymerase/3'-5' exonuclease PolX [Planctomycetota bacterium]